MGTYKGMRAMVQKIPSTTIAALVLLEDIANGAVEREEVYRDQESFFSLVQDKDWIISHQGFPRAVVITDHTGLPSHRVISARTG